MLWSIVIMIIVFLLALDFTEGVNSYGKNEHLILKLVGYCVGMVVIIFVFAKVF